MLIPHTKLPPDTLTGLIEDYATRETDTHHNSTLAERSLRLRKLLDTRQAFITYNVEHEQCCLVARHDVTEEDIRNWLSD
jgi:uncharacterized protein YheU (UPF0270 family)